MSMLNMVAKTYIISKRPVYAIQNEPSKPLICSHRPQWRQERRYRQFCRHENYLVESISVLPARTDRRL